MTERSMYAQIKQGDYQGWEALYRTRYRELVGVARRLCSDPESAVQEAMITFNNNLPRLDVDQNPAAYLTRLVRSRAMDQARHERLQPQKVEIPPEDEARYAPWFADKKTSVEGEVIMRETIQEVLTNVALVNRDVMRDKMLGYTDVAIAQRLKVPGGTVKSRVVHARSQLLPLQREVEQVGA